MELHRSHFVPFHAIMNATFHKTFSRHTIIIICYVRIAKPGESVFSSKIIVEFLYIFFTILHRPLLWWIEKRRADMRSLVQWLMLLSLSFNALDFRVIVSKVNNLDIFKVETIYWVPNYFFVFQFQI